MKLRKSLSTVGIATAILTTALAGQAAAADTNASTTSMESSSSTAAQLGTTAATVGYWISVHTANVDYAGTDGDVYLWVNGTTGSTGWMKLDNSDDNFERNDYDYFLRSAAGVGTIQSITIRFEPLGGANAEWLPDRITVNGVGFTNTQWFLKGSTTYRTLWA